MSAYFRFGIGRYIELYYWCRPLRIARQCLPVVWRTRGNVIAKMHEVLDFDGQGTRKRVTRWLKCYFGRWLRHLGIECIRFFSILEK